MNKIESKILRGIIERKLSNDDAFTDSDEGDARNNDPQQNNGEDGLSTMKDKNYCDSKSYQDKHNLTENMLNCEKYDSK